LTGVSSYHSDSMVGGFDFKITQISGL
jgi:hypothetical protein